MMVKILQATENLSNDHGHCVFIVSEEKEVKAFIHKNGSTA